MTESLSFYEAVTEFQLSEELLRSFTERGVSMQGEIRRLPSAGGELRPGDIEEFLQLLWQDWGSRTIPSAVKRELLQEAAGHCALCGRGTKYLDQAHIKRRGEELEWYSQHPHNLLLLCERCHPRYDDPSENKVTFEVIAAAKEKLLKRRFSEPFGVPTSLIVFHRTLHPIPVGTAVEEVPVELLGPRAQFFVVDATHLYSDGRLEDPAQALRIQDQKLTRLHKVLGENNDCRIVHAGVGHIPLLFHFGYAIASSSKLTLTELDRDAGGLARPLREDGIVGPLLRRKDVGFSLEATTAAIVVGISFSIGRADVSAVAGECPTVHLTLQHPGRDRVTHQAQCAAYARQFADALDDIRNQMPDVELVHVFYSGPVSLAVSCGRRISKTLHPPVVVHNYCRIDVPRYRWGVVLDRQNTEVVENGQLC